MREIFTMALLVVMIFCIIGSLEFCGKFINQQDCAPDSGPATNGKLMWCR